MLVGDVVLYIGVLVWLAISVGPWWLSLILLITSFILNIIHVYVRNKHTIKEQQEIQKYFKSLQSHFSSKK